MEINVTRIMNDHDLTEYSNSVHSSGLSNIGQITWRNAVEACEALDSPLVPSKGQDDLRSWIGEFGAWDSDEIKAMSDVETCALLLQFIASAGQEYEDAEERGELAEYLENQGGSLYKGDDSEWYFYVGM